MATRVASTAVAGPVRGFQLTRGVAWVDVVSGPGVVGAWAFAAQPAAFGGLADDACASGVVAAVEVHRAVGAARSRWDEAFAAEAGASDHRVSGAVTTAASCRAHSGPVILRRRSRSPSTQAHQAAPRSSAGTADRWRRASSTEARVSTSPPEMRTPRPLAGASHTSNDASRTVLGIVKQAQDQRCARRVAVHSRTTHSLLAGSRRTRCAVAAPVRGHRIR